ncbi:Rieske 2Fe-2S domain-containing protein [Hydrogenophaga sp. BPS33]|uniref:Rieske 2Fe-2S domain-containing protein n=1 Tax=Hydrogenophaga sp. BPS33 TaxID=2651974 RepID=UPI0013203135|nr:Rieske 2Fe-2S domain-containing protein [Hydrogenophaga sp. BPS33]QHE84742.1 Rieske 2Fe-2S domain-containing protein [Hydrogenophaga sp. BPS33]
MTTSPALERLRNDNHDLTHTGPGTVMGDLMRSYWIPAMKSSELESGGSPVRLLLLGEKLVAFRSPSGEVGVMDHRCPHRTASLFFARNEEGGLRCIYHGWKFNVEGACIDAPNIPEQEHVKEKVHTVAYQVHEANGLVWVYMGSAEVAPPTPKFEIMNIDEGELSIEFAQRDCNWLQALEGDIDTSHLAFLHVGNVNEEDLHENDPMRHVVRDRTVHLEVDDAPWGTTYCSVRTADDGKTHLRYANFLFPCWTQAPQGPFESNIFLRAWVPMDDTHMMLITVAWKKRVGLIPMKNGSPLPGVAPHELLPNTSDWLGRFRAVQNKENDYMIDREAQRTNEIWCGMKDIVTQDVAVTESMGDIADRTREHLVHSDLMIVRTRRRLLRAARDLAATGTKPPGVQDPFVYSDARSGEMVVPDYKHWTDTYQQKLKEAIRVSAAKVAQSELG